MVKEINQVREIIDTNKAYNRSAWNRGVKEYAHELLDNLEEQIEGGYVDLEDMKSKFLIRKTLLNGANDWKHYSYGGCSLIYNGDIAERICTPSQLKRTKGGQWRLNRYEDWLDIQARALSGAYRMIMKAFKVIAEEEKGA